MKEPSIVNQDTAVSIIGQWQWLTDLLIAGKLGTGLKFVNYVIGDYPMKLIPTSDSTLVFNIEEETWGSAYDSGFDFARVPMDLANTKDVIEKFTIEIVPLKKSGTLQMMWDQTLAQTEFTLVK